ncbi:MAG TPA: ATP-binding cassette domain-containing protein, partial [Solirubrobacteraceae bacterium]|nr:ATP-binding cassette domain-containing protein [Solirubrobacteraceae bacterium]
MSPFGIGRGKSGDEGREAPEPPEQDPQAESGWPEKEAPSTGEQPPPVQPPTEEPPVIDHPEPVAPEQPAAEPAAQAQPGAEEDSSRVAVVEEPRRPQEGDEDEYQWHTGLKRPTGVPDAIEFIDVHKAFGRNRILRGLNMGLPEGRISMILGPSGTGKSVCIKHMVGLLYPDDGDVLVHGESVPNMQDDELFDMRKKFGVLFQ